MSCGRLGRTICKDECRLVRADMDSVGLRKMSTHYVAARLVVKTCNMPFSVDVNMAKVEVSWRFIPQTSNKSSRDTAEGLVCFPVSHGASLDSECDFGRLTRSCTHIVAPFASVVEPSRLAIISMTRIETGWMRKAKPEIVARGRPPTTFQHKKM